MELSHHNRPKFFFSAPESLRGRAGLLLFHGYGEAELSRTLVPLLHRARRALADRTFPYPDTPCAAGREIGQLQRSLIPMAKMVCNGGVVVVGLCGRLAGEGSWYMYIDGPVVHIARGSTFVSQGTPHASRPPAARCSALVALRW